MLMMTRITKTKDHHPAMRLRGSLIRLAGLFALPALAGCRRSPTFSILGSFFPSWLVCMFAGIILAAIVNRIFVRFNLDREIAWGIVVYPCIALFFACTLWLVFFS
jgi:hypothetical protein